MVSIVLYERTGTGSNPVTSIRGSEKSSLTRDDRMLDIKVLRFYDRKPLVLKCNN